MRVMYVGPGERTYTGRISNGQRGEVEPGGNVVRWDDWHDGHGEEGSYWCVLPHYLVPEPSPEAVAQAAREALPHIRNTPAGRRARRQLEGALGLFQCILSPQTRD